MLLDFSLFDFDYQTKTYLLAVSGGVDSMSLAACFKSAELYFEVAHANFQLRGIESDRDAQLVSDWCLQNEVTYHEKKMNVAAFKSKHNSSTQMAARELRYDWFNALLSKNNLDFIVTGHHASDILETQLINLSRGSGIEGLTSLRPKNKNRLHPFIYFQKAHIIQYAKSINIPWREDASNANDLYVRNAIRNHVVPVLEDIHPAFWKNFVVSSKQLIEEKELIINHIRDIQNEWQEIEEKTFRIPIDTILGLNPLRTYLHHLFVDFGFRSVNEMIKLLESKSGAALCTNTFKLEKYRSDLFLYPKKDEQRDIYSIRKEGANRFVLSGYKNATTTKVLLDAKKVKLPLKIRRSDEKDLFYPEGMQGSKKLSKFFRDEKLNPIERKQIRILSDQNNAVICVLNRRFDRRYLATTASKEIIEICIELAYI